MHGRQPSGSHHPKITFHISSWAWSGRRLTFLGWSAKAHSNIQRVAPTVPPPANRDQLSLWHFVYFRNEFNCSTTRK